MKLDILYLGEPGGTSRQRAEALREMGHSVRHVRTGAPDAAARQLLFRILLRAWGETDWVGANRALLREIRSRPAQLLWIDKGLSLRPATLVAARGAAPGLRIVGYSPDDMLHPIYRQPRYWRGFPLYDLHVTTKSYNVDALRARGARDVLFVDNAYDPATHRPLALNAEERARYATDVGFVGTFEEDRARHILGLAQAGVAVSVWGHGWRRLGVTDTAVRVRDEELLGLEYAKAINATKINLGFLRKAARDLQTTRSIEIPACNAFMLAERTEEHLRLFAEGREAEFFASFEELLAKTRHYLRHENERALVASAGYRRCVDGGYSYHGRLASVLDYLMRERGLAR